MTTGIKMIDLKERQCRFAVDRDGGTHMFCGESTELGSSWCPAHRRLVYEVVPARRSSRPFRLP